MQIGVQPDLSVAPGTCFFPEHFNEPPVKDLMTVSVDPATGVPSFNSGGSALNARNQMCMLRPVSRRDR